MKLLLMVPITSLVKDAPTFPDLGIGYIANAVRKKGFPVYLRSWNMNPSIEDFKVWLKEYRPDVVGIKVFTKDVAAANETIRIIKSINQNILVVLGGPHVSSSRPEEIIEDFPNFDFAFQGEAETGFPLLLEKLADRNNGKSYNRDFQNIPGLVWKSDGRVLNNPRMFVTDLDALDTPLWELMDPKDYSPPQIVGWERGYLAPIVVTRGCPANCTYCSAYNVNGKTVRTRSTRHVLEEIDYLYHKYDVHQLNFMDTRFTHNEEVVKEICDGILKLGLKVTWECIGYEGLDRIDQKMLELMKRAGCKVINAGIESGSDRIRRAIRKEGTTEEIREKIRLIKETGIAVHGFFMFGFPGETGEDMEETIRYAFSLPLDFVHFDIVYPHPGTEALAYIKKKYNIKRLDWETFDISTTPYHLSELPSDKVFKLMKKAQVQSLLKPSNLYRRFRRKYLRLMGRWRPMHIKRFIKSVAKDTLRFIFWYPCRFLVSFLPLRAIYLLSSFAGTFWYYLSLSKRGIITEEFSKIFGSAKSFQELGKITKDSFRNMGKDRIEILLYPRLKKENIDEIVTVEGTERLDYALSRGKGVILLIAHFGANKMVMPALGFKGYKINQIAGRPTDWGNVVGVDSYMAKKALELELNAEKKFPARFIYITGSIRPALRCLKENEILCLAVDGGGGSKRVKVDFLNRSANLSPNFIGLAKVAGATILPAFVIRQPDNRHRVAIEEPLILKTFDDEKEEWEYNTRIFAEIFSRYFYLYPCLYARKLLNMRLQAGRDPVPFFDDYNGLPLTEEARKCFFKEEVV